MPLLFSRISSRGVMLRHVASLWFLSRHGIWLDYRLILICWVMALNEHIWLFYFSLCVPVCVRAYTHIHTCVYVHMLARGSYIFVYVCARACLYTCLHVGVTYTCVHVFVWKKNISIRYCSSGRAHLELPNVANWRTSEHWEPFHHHPWLSLRDFYSSNSCPYACIAAILVTDPHLIVIDEICLLGLHKNLCVYSTNIPLACTLCQAL